MRALRSSEAEAVVEDSDKEDIPIDYHSEGRVTEFSGLNVAAQVPGDALVRSSLVRPGWKAQPCLLPLAAELIPLGAKIIRLVTICPMIAGGIGPSGAFRP